jgi:hypothetical protein
MLYKEKIGLFANKYKNRILKISKRGINLQGKNYTIQIFWDGRVEIDKDNKRIRFGFNPVEIEKYI